MNDVLEKEKPRRSGVFSSLAGGASRTVLTRRSTTRQRPIATLMLRTVQRACQAPDAKLSLQWKGFRCSQTAVHARLVPAETTRSIRRESVAITVRASAIGEYTENSIAAGECDD
ncbi:hypothetical protein KDX32_01440 [Burkholderia ambifaria]|uniref:hypothetical protein n=1 Tax=Burkholderia ambifaria TaxID=152480 RepID=UPI001B9E9B5E|nr:hypothetical protein [Burkholderia ambifaria]MBR8061746.1 hypothetical protein [Burkholderia ambifaria]MBR8174825.1 hypothetical protein [Burkholderia ambifaria]